MKIPCLLRTIRTSIPLVWVCCQVFVGLGMNEHSLEMRVRNYPDVLKRRQIDRASELCSEIDVFFSSGNDFVNKDENLVPFSKVLVGKMASYVALWQAKGSKRNYDDFSQDALGIIGQERYHRLREFFRNELDRGEPHRRANAAYVLVQGLCDGFCRREISERFEQLIGKRGGASISEWGDFNEAISYADNLSCLGDSTVVPLLAEIMNDLNLKHGFRALAIKALSRLGKQDIIVESGALGSKDGRVAYYAFRALSPEDWQAASVQRHAVEQIISIVKGCEKLSSDSRLFLSMLSRNMIHPIAALQEGDRDVLLKFATMMLHSPNPNECRIAGSLSSTLLDDSNLQIWMKNIGNLSDEYTNGQILGAAYRNCSVRELKKFRQQVEVSLKSENMRVREAAEAVRDKIRD